MYINSDSEEIKLIGLLSNSNFPKRFNVVNAIKKTQGLIILLSNPAEFENCSYFNPNKFKMNMLKIKVTTEVIKTIAFFAVDLQKAVNPLLNRAVRK